LERAAVVFLYNLLMLTALSLLSPVWAPWMILNQQRRRTFCGRLAMSRLAGQGRGRSCAAAADRIWIHALSVGEVLSAQPLVAALAKRYGPERLVFTASTRTGFETAARVIAPAVGALRYFPYDTLFSVNRALAVVRPRQVVFVETDIWPNFLYRLSQHRIPVCLVNARLSNRYVQGLPAHGLFHGAAVGAICPHLCANGCRSPAVPGAWVWPTTALVTAGNLKFDQCLG
jgi:3-deoxy-D-manno-octulosonic-acid transferase